MSAFYVFALTNQAARPLRYADRRIEFVEVAGIHAAVERVTRRPAISEVTLRAQHEIVLKIAAAVDAILPARFGALVDSHELEALVTMRMGPIRKALELVAGRVQMTVRIFGGSDLDFPVANVLHDETGTNGKSRSDPGTTYLEQRRRAAAALPAGDAAAVSRAARPLVADERTQRGEGRVQWTLYHLVDRSLVPRYQRAMAPFRAPEVSVTGPWPPFAFVPDLWP